MVGYDDPYNAALTRESNARARQHGLNIDRLNGSGKAAAKNEKMTGGMMCPQHIRPVTDPATGETYQNACKMAAAKRGAIGSSRCCSRCKNCKCGGGTSGGGPATPIRASKWFDAEDQALKRAFAQTIIPKNVAAARAEKDLGAGKYGAITNAHRNVTPQGLTPPSTAMKRMDKDLGAGKGNMRGGAKDEDYDDDEEDYEDGDDCGEMEGGGEGDEPETLREMKSICDDYEQKKLTGGAMTKRIRAMMPRGKKGMSVALSKALQKLKKRGRASFMRRLKMGMVMPGLVGQKHSEGNGRYVGGSKDHGEIERLHDSVFGGSKLTGGNGPVAPTVEALAGYDNSKQPKGLMPPPSVNQQPGLRGGALPLNEGYPAEPQPTQRNKGRPRAVRGGFAGLSEVGKFFGSVVGRGMSGGELMMYPGGDPNYYNKPQNYLGGRQLIPENQLPSRIGGGKGRGRFAPDGDYIGPSTGAIIPALQSEVSPAGSGKRGSRGAMVAKLMREKGMSLGEASRALKGGATAEDFARGNVKFW